VSTRELRCGLLLLTSLAVAIPATAGTPINLGSGDASYSVPLFTIPLAGTPYAPPLDFKLSYHSQDPLRPTLSYLPMGLGWTHSFNETLLPVDPMGTLLYHRGPEGWDSEYIMDAADHWVARSPGGLHATVTRTNASGTNDLIFTMTDVDGTRTIFGADPATVTYGRWLMTEPHWWDHSIRGTYSGSDLVSVVDAMGRAVTLAYTAHVLTSITLPGGAEWRFSYTNGLLSAISDPLHGGTAWRSFAYQTNSLGVPRLLTFARDDDGAALQAFTYDALDRANGASSEGGRDALTVQYDTPTSSKTTVTRTQSAGITLATVYSLAYQGRRWLVTKSEGGCATCTSGADTITYEYYGSNHLRKRTVGTDLSGSGGADERVTTEYTYNADGMVLTRKEAVGKTEERTTTYTYGHVSPWSGPWPSFVTRVDEPSVKPGEVRSTTYSWDSLERVLTSTVSGYLGPTGSLATYTTVTTYADDYPHDVVSIAGPRTGQLETMTYYPKADSALNRRGRLHTRTTTVSTQPAVTLTSTYDNYDAYGTALSVTDPNDVETQRVTDLRGRVTSIVEKKPASDANEPPDYTTTYTFDSRDRLTAIQRPLGNRVSYRYEDGTNRLTDTIRQSANGLEQERLHVTLNLLGGKVQEDAQACTTPAAPCTTWSTQRTESFAYDGRNRLSGIQHPTPAGSQVLYDYDSRGNLRTIQDERHTSPNTVYTYDPLNRLKTTTQVVAGPDYVTSYLYDVRDNLVTVTDPNLNETTYAVDDWARVQSQGSPVSGTTTYAYDEAGNITLTTAANGTLTTRTFDLANRVTGAVSAGPEPAPGHILSYQYDDATAGAYRRGRLSTMTERDQAHAPWRPTTYTYDRRGLLRVEDREIAQGNGWYPDPAHVYQTGHAYDANGNRTRIVYPSGRVVEYTYDFADRPTGAAATAPVARTYASGGIYKAFGPLFTLQYGNGTVQSTAFDSRYRPTRNTLTKPPQTLADYTYGSDALGNIETITDELNAGYNRTFGYDDVNRLTTANTGASLWGTGFYNYDAMGNITSFGLGANHTATFTLFGTTPKISSVIENGVQSAVTYDNAGNDTSNYDAAAHAVTDTAWYDGRNLLWIDGTDPAWSSYIYDGRGVRVFKTNHNSTTNVTTTTDYVYSPELHLLNTVGSTWTRVIFPPPPETTILSTSTEEFIWLGDRPIAQEQEWTSGKGQGSSTSWMFTDHLGTPTITTGANGVIESQTEYEPYGTVAANRVGSSPTLRLPGQESDGYNIFRWYRSNWGRYSQPDPIGHEGGVNLFSYVSGRPTVAADPRALAPCGQPPKHEDFKDCHVYCGAAHAWQLCNLHNNLQYGTGAGLAVAAGIGIVAWRHGGPVGPVAGCLAAGGTLVLGLGAHYAVEKYGLSMFQIQEGLCHQSCDVNACAMPAGPGGPLSGACSQPPLL